MNDVSVKKSSAALEEKRCINPRCKKLLCKAKIIGIIEIKCKCGVMNLFKG